MSNVVQMIEMTTFVPETLALSCPIYRYQVEFEKLERDAAELEESVRRSEGSPLCHLDLCQSAVEKTNKFFADFQKDFPHFKGELANAKAVLLWRKALDLRKRVMKTASTRMEQVHKAVEAVNSKIEEMESTVCLSMGDLETGRITAQEAFEIVERLGNALNNDNGIGRIYNYHQLFPNLIGRVDILKCRIYKFRDLATLFKKINQIELGVKNRMPSSREEWATRQAEIRNCSQDFRTLCAFSRKFRPIFGKPFDCGADLEQLKRSLIERGLHLRRFIDQQLAPPVVTAPSPCREIKLENFAMR